MGDKNKTLRPIDLGHTMKYEDGSDSYVLTLVHKKKRKWWLWLLLLLLPLLLLIRCERDITVDCVDAENGALVSGALVSMEYDTHYLFKDGHFFPTEHISRQEVADERGRVVFKNVPCSVFSYIFYAFSKAKYSAENECHSSLSTWRNFHYVKHVKLEMLPLRDDLRVLVLDRQTEDVIPDATVIYRYKEDGKEKVDSTHTDASGVALIPAMRVCSSMELLQGQHYGYEDDTLAHVACRDLLVPDEERALRLTPIKESFTFFVKNAQTREPIPAARCEVTLTWPNQSRYEEMRIVTTSVDGKGTAFYDDAFILSTIHIHASKPHFRDSVLTGGPWTVADFIRQDEDTRTVWLEPEPYVQEFVNVDSLSLRPIPGVSNEIRITHPDGTTEVITEISNSNGVFPVSAREDDTVEIISRCEPGYKPKETRIPVFRDAEDGDRKIKMEPEMESLVFRTVNALNPNELVPDCSLACTGTISGALKPTNSGRGEFTVTFRKVERLTIVASKYKWVRTTDKVNNKTWDYLKVDQERRDIPLKLDLPPCSGGAIVPKTGNYHVASYSMGTMEGTSTISGDFYSIYDWLTVYDGTQVDPKWVLIPRHQVIDTFNIPFHYTQGAVTVVVETDQGDRSSWQYVVNCPK